MEPMIYKPSIYNGAGIYKTGAEGGGGNQEYIGIGEFNYKVIQIDNLLWIDSDLKSILPGINFPNTLKWDIAPGCVIYDNDTTTYGIYGQNRGLLYNCRAGEIIQDYLNNNLPGWRIATVADWNALINFAGGSNNAYKKLCAPILWPNTSSMMNDYGFNAIPTGYVSNGNFVEVSSAVYFATPISSPTTRSLWIDANQNYKFWIGNFTYNYSYCAIRLCKDA